MALSYFIYCRYFTSINFSTRQVFNDSLIFLRGQLDSLDENFWCFFHSCIRNFRDFHFSIILRCCVFYQVPGSVVGWIPSECYHSFFHRLLFQTVEGFEGRDHLFRTYFEILKIIWCFKIVFGKVLNNFRAFRQFRSYFGKAEVVLVNLGLELPNLKWMCIIWMGIIKKTQYEINVYLVPTCAFSLNATGSSSTVCIATITWHFPSKTIEAFPADRVWWGCGTCGNVVSPITGHSEWLSVAYFNSENIYQLLIYFSN